MTLVEQQRGYLDALDRITYGALRALRGLWPEERQEALQDARASAWKWWVRLIAKGRDPAACAGSIGYRAGQHARASRGMTGQRKTARTQRHTKSIAYSVNELMDTRHGTPADQAATRIDYAAFRAAQDGRRRHALDLMVDGERTCDIAAILGCTNGRVSQLRRELATAWWGR